MDFSPEALRKRFKELNARHDKLAAALLKLKAERDEKFDTLTPKQMRAYDEKIKKANVPELYAIEMERAAVARALGGKTGEPG